MEENSNIRDEEITAAEEITETSVAEAVASETIETEETEISDEVGSKSDEALQCDEEEVKPEDETDQLQDNCEVLPDNDNGYTENEASDISNEQPVEQEESNVTAETDEPVQESTSEPENECEITAAEFEYVMKNINLLKDGLNQALTTLSKKNADIRLIEEKLDTYKRTVEDKLVNMFFIDIIGIIDNIKRMSALYKVKDENPGYVPCDTFEFYATDLECILLNNSVEIIPTTVGEKYNPRNHRIIKKIPIDDKSQHGIIEQVFSEGYFFGGRVISPAKVSVYFYTEPKG